MLRQLGKRRAAALDVRSTDGCRWLCGAPKGAREACICTTWKASTLVRAGADRVGASLAGPLQESTITHRCILLASPPLPMLMLCCLRSAG